MRGGNPKLTFIKIDIPIQIKPRFLLKKNVDKSIGVVRIDQNVLCSSQILCSK